ncbi:MAG: glycosyltransferase [Deltaproteobacteria bacterium]|nr:glycosyltransferase [Deltaproteobacteria bacterium]MBW2085850.1 glycosyltransferase [Deltaproteobacteria bacterium]
MKTTALVPVFNEEKTIKNVLSTLNNSELIEEIVVVDDGSTDNSLEKVRIFKRETSKKLKVISLKENVGKGGAVKIATKDLKTEIIFFCDGDLNNFKEEHIRQILEPFNYDKNIMSIGITQLYGKVGTSLYRNLSLSGERALPYSHFMKIKENPLIEKWGLELVMNDYCKRNNIPIHRCILEDVEGTLKPKKWKRGNYYLIKEIFEITVIMIKLKMSFF